jgi:hypothetical protein
MSIEQQLKQELAALEHELRRVRDGLERNRSQALELRASQLSDSISTCQRELRQYQANVE